MENDQRPFLSLPCKMSLQDFSAGEKGYHCQSCDKVLTDFRGKTNSEVRETIRTSEQKVCGIFHRDQFDFKTSQVSFSAAQKRVGLSLLGILGFLGPVITTGCADQPNDVSRVKQKAFNNLKFPMDVKGTLRDEKTGKALPLAGVAIYQDGKVIRRSTTDANGDFSITLQQADLITENFDFIVDKSAYKTDTLKAFSLGKAKGQKIRLTLKADAACTITAPGKVATKEIIWNGEPEPTFGFTPPEPVKDHKTPEGLPEPPEVTAGVPMPEEP